jgi:hypothetical protein
MRQARESGWYAVENGPEVFITKGTVRQDNHPDVLHAGALFDVLPTDEAPPKKTTAKKGDDS